MAAPVTSVEIDRLNQWIREAKGGDEWLAGKVRARLVEIAEDHTRWQYVIHGDTERYRKAVTNWYCDTNRLATARRFALCGRGDMLGVRSDGGDAKLRSMGCGCRTCPRCSRRGGRRALRSVEQILGGRPHETLWHFVFTQRALPGEPLDETRERFEAAWKKTARRMKRDGLLGGLACYHVTRTMMGAWHWHVHLIGEVASPLSNEDLFAKFDQYWRRSRGDQEHEVQGLWGRVLAQPGPALKFAEARPQMDLWRESTDNVSACLQYAVRDVLQGVEKWVQNIRTGAEAREFAQAVNQAKVHRLIGTWRKDSASSSETGDGTKESTDKTTSAPAVGAELPYEWVGSVDSVIAQFVAGVEGAAGWIRALELSVSNRSTVADRLRTVLRSVVG